MEALWKRRTAKLMRLSATLTTAGPTVKVSPLSLSLSGILNMSIAESETSVWEADQAIALSPNAQVIDLTESIVEDFSERDSESSSLDVEVTPPGFITPPVSRQYGLRVSAMQNRQTLRRLDAWVGTPRQARYIPLERPPQGQNSNSSQVLTRPRRLDTPQQVRSNYMYLIVLSMLVMSI